MGLPCLRSQILMVPSSYPTTALFPKDQSPEGTLSRENRVGVPKFPLKSQGSPSMGQAEAGMTGVPRVTGSTSTPRKRQLSHHQGGRGHRLQGSWGPGRSYSHHLAPSTSKCCRQQCPLTGQVPEGATPSTGQRGRLSNQGLLPSLSKNP